MRIEKKELEALTMELTIVIEKDDYLQEYNNNLEKYRQKAQTKGFRKGKTPLSLVKKMYGSGTMQETISKILNEKLASELSSGEYEILGEPIFSDNESIPEIDHTDFKDYTYKFEIGLQPKFEVTGAAEGDEYGKYNVIVSDEMIDNEVDMATSKYGNQNEVEDTIVDNDVVYFEAKELSEGKIKEGGIVANFSVNIDKVTEAYQKSLLKMKKSDSLDFDIFNLEKDLSEEHVYKYLLKVKVPEADENEVGKEYRAMISKVIRNEKADFNQTFFDGYFGKDVVNSTEEARDKIKGHIRNYFLTEEINYLNREIMEALVEKNAFEMPVNFLKKWVSQENEVSDNDFEKFIQEMKWRIIKGKLMKRYEVKVEEQDILTYFAGMIRNYSPYIDEASLKNMAFSLMQNKEQVQSASEIVSSGKLFDEIRKVVSLKEVDIDEKDFLERVKEINKKMK